MDSLTKRNGDGHVRKRTVPFFVELTAKVRSLILAFLLCCSVSSAADIYIAKNGKDTGNGTLSAPFKTLERARDEIRKLKQTGKLVEPVTVQVRGGTYELPQTLMLDSRDSGVTWRAYREEKPILTVATAITGFKRWKGRILKANAGRIYFRQLFYKDKRQQLARYPNYDPQNPYVGGWAYADGKYVPMSQDIPGEDRHTLMYKREDQREWVRPEEGEVFVFPRYNWWNNIVGIKSIDHDKRTITLEGDCSYPIRPGDRYYVRNLLEELDSPGEWYLDKQSGVLYFWPPDNSAHPTVYVPRLQTILELSEGTADVTFRGFTFELFEGTGIKLIKTNRCRIAGSVIRNGGDYDGIGISVENGNDNSVIGNDIYEIGSHGIYISGGDRLTLTAGNNVADNNYIHHVGVFYKQGVGISLNGCGNRASHNLIHDTPRFAIQFSGNNLVLEYNHLRHTNLETADTGAIYTSGRDWLGSRGSIIRYNYVHDSIGLGYEDGNWNSPYYSWGIYLDDNTGGVDVIGNIVVRAFRGLIHLHNGRDNLIENNVFVDGKAQQAEFNGWTDTQPYWKMFLPGMVAAYNSVKDQPAWKNMRNMEIAPDQAVLPGGLIMSGNVFRYNIVYYTDPSAKLFNTRNLSLGHNDLESNLYWHMGLSLKIGLGGNIGEWDLNAWRAAGKDVHSIAADPLFVNPEKDDYRLRSDSPAFALGFKEIPIEKIGPYQDEFRASWPIIEAEGAREHLIASAHN